MSLLEFHWRAPETLISVEDYRRAALRRLPQMVATFIEGGADDLAAVRGNAAAFERWALRPRVLAGIESVDLSTTLLGTTLALPVVLAPTGLTGMTRWDGDIAAARAAETHGTRYALSSISSWSIQEVAAATSTAPFLQLYPKSSGLTETLMKRAVDHGIDVMMVTVDCPVMGNREGERKQGMGRPPVLTARRALNVARHPAWVYRLLRHQRISGRNLVEENGIRA
ncbi:alpha-hydroxy-acid oxidizing protein, partial [Streptomyces sp. NPDC059083]|uniref:alpha-hydroxy acid oxidase n=1 Tax=Streptomyces sp. NPDC059083 TaxID=3346721 RepID=UPI0036AD6A34